MTDKAESQSRSNNHKITVSEEYSRANGRKKLICEKTFTGERFDLNISRALYI